jgi:DNA repair ATPase RecN
MKENNRDITIKKLTEYLTEKSIEYKLAKKKTIESRLQLRLLEKNLVNLEKIKVLILEIAKHSKNEIKEYIENIVTNALQIVYGNEYSFEIHIEQKYNQEEIYFYLAKKDGTLLEPKEDTVAGGMLDIMSLGLKLAVLSLTNSEPVLFLDEPLRFLGKYSYIGGNILKEFSKEFNIQIIMITHDDALVEVADKVFKIGNDNDN